MQNNNNINSKKIVIKEIKSFDNNSENINIREKINELFVYYEKRYAVSFSKIWWPINIFYGGKKYYPSIRLERLKDPQINIILYYCNNHLLNTNNKKLKFNNQKCPGQLEYNRAKGTFVLKKRHNAINDGDTDKIYDHIIDVDNTVLECKEFNSKMIDFLNSHPLYNFKMFKKYVNIY